MNKKRQKYRFEFFSVPSNGQSVESDCADISFYNYGTADLIVNDVITLQTNQFITLGGNEAEEDETIYNLKFNAAGGGTTKGVIVRRIYVDK